MTYLLIIIYTSLGISESFDSNHLGLYNSVKNHNQIFQIQLNLMVDKVFEYQHVATIEGNIVCTKIRGIYKIELGQKLMLYPKEHYAFNSGINNGKPIDEKLYSNGVLKIRGMDDKLNSGKFHKISTESLESFYQDSWSLKSGYKISKLNSEIVLQYRDGSQFKKNNK